MNALAVVVCLLLLGCCDAHRSMRLFRELLSGTFDNEEQVVCAERSGVESDGRIQSTVTLVTIPPLYPSTCFFVEQFSGNDPSNIFRTRIYRTFKNGEGTLFTEFYRITDTAAEKYRNGHFNPEIFLQMSADELVYSEGCDAVWERTGERSFQSRMYQDECYIADGTLRDSHVITDGYLTTDYSIFSTADGLLFTENFFNMTRQVAPQPIGGFSDVLEALRSGYQVRYHAEVEGCWCTTMRTIAIESHGGLITNFEYTFSSQPTIVFTSQRKVLTPDMVTWRYAEVTLKADGSASIQLSIWNHTTNTRIHSLTDDLRCKIKDSTGDGSLEFYKSSPIGHAPLGHHGDVTRKLREGGRLTYVIEEEGCTHLAQSEEISTSIRGGVIQNADVTEGSEVIEFATTDVISNQFPSVIDGDFTRKLQSCSIHRSGVVDVSVTLNDYYTQEALITSSMTCSLFPQALNGTVTVYKVSESQPIVCPIEM